MADLRDETDPDAPDLDSRAGIDEPEGGAGLPSASLAAHSVGGGGSRGRRRLRRRTDRDIWALTWPVTLSMSLASAVGLIDIAMLGRLGTNTLAGVGYAMQFFFLSQAVLMAVGVACVAMMSRAIGARVVDRARHALASSLVISQITAVVITTVALLFPEAPIRLLGAPEEIVTLAAPYFQITVASSCLFAVSFTFENAFRAARNTRTPMIVSAVVMVVKVVLNALLIFGLAGFPELGLTGAAWATLGSQAVAALLFVGLARSASMHEALHVKAADFRVPRDVFVETLRLAVPGVIERFGMNLALMSYFYVLGQYGPVEIAAYTVGVRILSFSWIPGIGFSTAASTLVGQALGASDADQAQRAGWRAARMSLAIALVLGLVFALARNELGGFFTDDPAVLEALGPFMLVMALSQPFLQLHFTLGGALRGAGDTVTPLWAAIVGNWMFRVPLAVTFAYVLEWSVLFVWFALTFDHLARSVWMVVAFRRGHWARNLGLSTREPAVASRS